MRFSLVTMAMLVASITAAAVPELEEVCGRANELNFIFPVIIFDFIH